MFNLLNFRRKLSNASRKIFGYLCDIQSVRLTCKTIIKKAVLRLQQTHLFYHVEHKLFTYEHTKAGGPLEIYVGQACEGVVSEMQGRSRAWSELGSGCITIYTSERASYMTSTRQHGLVHKLPKQQL